MFDLIIAQPRDVGVLYRLFVQLTIPKTNCYHSMSRMGLILIVKLARATCEEKRLCTGGGHAAVRSGAQTRNAGRRSQTITFCVTAIRVGGMGP